MPLAIERSRRRKQTCRPLLSAPLLLLASCLVDSDKKCDENQEVRTGLLSGCVCAPDSVLNAEKNGCTECGEHEVVKEGACACEVGYARLSAGGPCTASMLGATCDAQTPCAPDFPYCAPGGYCTTSACTSSASCPGGYTCDTSGSPSYCIRPPTGLGNACSSPADCAGFEADYCGQSSCVVSGCASTVDCRDTYACCDYRALGAKDVCVPATALMNGKCPIIMTDPVVR